MNSSILVYSRSRYFPSQFESMNKSNTADESGRCPTSATSNLIEPTYHGQRRNQFIKGESESFIIERSACLADSLGSIFVGGPSRRGEALGKRGSDSTKETKTRETKRA